MLVKAFPRLLLRICLLLLVGTAAFASAKNLPVIAGRPLIPARTPVRSPGQPLRFVIVASLYDHPFWTEVWKGARQVEESLNINVDMTGPRRASLDSQLELLEMATAAQVDGIITQGTPDPQIALAIAKAADRGIPVITVGTDVPGRRLTYVGINNYEAGRLAALELVKRSGNKGVIAIIRGGLGAQEDDERVRGFRDTVAGLPGMQIAAIETSELNPTIAGQKALKILAEHPEVTAFYGTTTLDGVGIARSVKQLGNHSRMVIIGFHHVVGIEEYAPPDVTASIQERPAEIGRTAVTLLEAYLRRDARPPQSTYIPFTVRSGGGGL